MTPLTFKNSWVNTDEPLSPLSKSRLDRFNLSKTTFDFLNIAGLPAYCEPNLTFANKANDICKLTEQYDFEEGNPKLDKYIVIGSCRDGDAIAIDTEKNDEVVELDHEDGFSSMYFNYSIETLADFLILYRDFEEEVLQGKNAEDTFQVFNFTDDQFEKLKSRMHSIDGRALIEAGFWKDELEIMLSIRKEKFAKS